MSDNVTQLLKLLAWAPSTEPLKLRLSAILVAPGQEIDRDFFLMFLAERIQALVNACPDPRAATKALQKDLWDAGLYPDLGSTPPDQAGARLVETNPGTAQRLRSWSVMPSGTQYPQEMAPAREALNAERYDPYSSLRNWSAVLSRLP